MPHEDEHHDAPWLARRDWAKGEVRWSDAKRILFPACFAAFWNAVTVPAFWIGWNQPDLEPGWLAFLGVFQLVGVGAVVETLFRVVRHMRHGVSTFRMSSTPGVIGGELAGVVLAPKALHAADRIRAKLACMRTRRRRGVEDSILEVLEPVWEDERVIAKTLRDNSGKAGVPIRFTIPSNARPSDPDADLPVVWRLSIAAAGPGPDYVAEFDVPVFRTADSREGVVVETATLTEYEQAESLADRLAEEGVRYDEGAGVDSLRIVCPPGRSWRSAAILGAFAVLFLGVAIGVGLFAPGFGRWIGVVGSSLVGVAALVASLECYLGATDTRIDGEHWCVRSGWYGFRGAGAEFTAADIRRINAKEAMTESGGSGAAKKWNHVIATLKDGRRLTLVRYLLSRATERELLTELRRRAGLKK